MVLVVAGALAVAVHIGLGGALLANSGWTAAADVVLVVVLGKVALIILGRTAIRHRKGAHTDAVSGDHSADERAAQ